MKSDIVKKGIERAPHRSLFKAMGYTDEEINRPLIGVANSKNEIIPGHIHLDKIAEAVKAGIRMAGGTPVEFGAIGVCDGIAMGHMGMKYSLATRELIADSCEAMGLAHSFDGMVFIPNCDKIVPGMLMAAARINVPSVVISGGPMLSIKQKRKTAGFNSVFEAVGAFKAGKMTEEEVSGFGRSCMSGLWFMFRNVYCKFHELPYRSSWYGTYRQRNHSCSLCRENQTCKICRNEDNGTWWKRI